MTFPQHEGPIYSVRVTQDEVENLQLPPGIDSFALYGEYTANQFYFNFAPADMGRCLCVKGGWRNGRLVPDITAVDAVERPDSILNFMLRYAEPPPNGRYPLQIKEMQLGTVSALVATQSHFHEQLKSQQTLPPKMVQTILDYLRNDGITIETVTDPV